MSDLTPILAKTPVDRIEDVLARIEEIDAALPATDGIACFNKLYLQVTRNLLAAEQAGEFVSLTFLSVLDLAFGNLYFSALKEMDSGGDSPAAWRPLFEARSSTGIAPIQFALAGMNAHINRDMPVGLVRAFSSLGIEMTDPSPQHDDFERVNDVLAATEAQMHATYFTGMLAQLDKTFSGAEDVIAMWSVRKARELAWANGEILWELRRQPLFEDEYVTALLDGGFGFAGRLLLQETAD